MRPRRTHCSIHWVPWISGADPAIASLQRLAPALELAGSDDTRQRDHAGQTVHGGNPQIYRAAQLSVSQDGSTLVYPAIDFGLTASHPAAAHGAEMDLELVQPGTRAEAQELEPGRIRRNGGALGTRMGGSQEQARQDQRADRCQHCSTDLVDGA